MSGSPHPPKLAEGDAQAVAEAFLRDWGVALHTYGVPAHRLEASLSELAARLGVEAQFLSTPTSLMCAFGAAGEQRVTLERLTPGSSDLGRLSALDALGQAVLAGERSVGEGRARLVELLAAPPPFGRLWATLAYSGSSAAAAYFLGGAPVSIAAATLAGLLVGVVAALARSPEAGRVVVPLGGLLAALVAALAAREGASIAVVTLAGVLVLLPGLSITVGMTELATGNLVSGTARLAGAVATLLQLAFGIAVGRYAAEWLPPAARALRASLPAALDIPALALMVLTLVVLLQARWRDLGWVGLGTVTGWLGARLVSELIGPDLTPFFGAFAVTVVANLAARLARKPSSLVAVPGLLTLVPGSLGLRGMTTMLDDAIKGVELLFQTGFVAVGLVAGVLVAHVVVAPRRSL